MLIETPFREAHYKRQILAPMEKASPPEIEIIDCGPKRKKGTFPPLFFEVLTFKGRTGINAAT